MSGNVGGATLATGISQLGKMIQDTYSQKQALRNSNMQLMMELAEKARIEQAKIDAEEDRRVADEKTELEGGKNIAKLAGFDIGPVKAKDIVQLATNDKFREEGLIRANAGYHESATSINPEMAKLAQDPSTYEMIDAEAANRIAPLKAALKASENAEITLDDEQPQGQDEDLETIRKDIGQIEFEAAHKKDMLHRLEGVYEFANINGVDVMKFNKDAYKQALYAQSERDADGRPLIDPVFVETMADKAEAAATTGMTSQAKVFEEAGRNERNVRTTNTMRDVANTQAAVGVFTGLLGAGKESAKAGEGSKSDELKRYDTLINALPPVDKLNQYAGLQPVQTSIDKVLPEVGSVANAPGFIEHMDSFIKQQNVAGIGSYQQAYDELTKIRDMQQEDVGFDGARAQNLARILLVGSKKYAEKSIVDNGDGTWSIGGSGTNFDPATGFYQNSPHLQKLGALPKIGKTKISAQGSAETQRRKLEAIDRLQRRTAEATGIDLEEE